MWYEYFDLYHLYRLWYRWYNNLFNYPGCYTILNHLIIHHLKTFGIGGTANSSRMCYVNNLSVFSPRIAAKPVSFRQSRVNHNNAHLLYQSAP